MASYSTARGGAYHETMQHSVREATVRRPLAKLVCGPPSSCRFCAWNSALKGVELVAEHSFANNYRDFNRSNKKQVLSSTFDRSRKIQTQHFRSTLPDFPSSLVRKLTYLSASMERTTAPMYANPAVQNRCCGNYGGCDEDTISAPPRNKKKEGRGGGRRAA